MGGEGEICEFCDGFDMILSDFGMIWSENVMINEISRGEGGSGGNEGKNPFIRKKKQILR